MEVAVAEEKKKIFRARKTMKISDRQQLDSLHSTLLTGTPPSSNSSSPPLLNGTHKEDGPKRLDKDQNNTTDSKSPQAASPVSPGSVGSPQPSLSLNLSPSPPCSKSPKEVAPSSPVSPFHSLNFELKKMEAESSGKKTPSTTSPADCSETASAEVNDGRDKATEVTPKLGKNEKNEEKKTAQTEKEETHAGRKEPEKDSSKDSVKDTARSSPVLPSVSVKNSEKDHRRELKYTEPMETDGDCVEVKTPEDAKAASGIEKKPASRKATNSSRSSSPRPASSSLKTPKQELKVKDEKGDKEKIKEEKDVTKGVKTGPTKEEKMQVDFVKVESKKEKTAVAGSSKQSRPSSTPPSDTGVKDRSSTSGLKRTLSEGGEQDEQKVERDGKRPKVEGVELEAQLEVKITAKAGSRVKLEKVVQQLVEERLRVLELTVFDQSLQELKDRVEKIDCATKHQTTLNMLQAKIGRLAKKFGEANQASENKKKQETLAAAVAAAAKTVATVNTPPTQRPLRNSVELKQTSTTHASTNATASAGQPTPASIASTTTTMVSQAPILQLITSASSAATTLGAGITTQSPTGTLLLKTAPQGQPLLIQVPLSMANGQPGTLVNIPVSSLSAATSLSKVKTTTPTATFILKPGPSTTTVAASTSATATVPPLHASTTLMSPAQISLARAMYHGGAGGINTPSAGVSVTTARTPTQPVSVAGAMSSASSPAASGPAATGSTAPGPPQGISLTSKTDNQATGSTPTKTAPAAGRPKGSVIDLTDDDDDVQVTGVKNAVAPPAAANQRPPPLKSIPLATAARSSPQINQNSVTNAQLTIHHRPPQDSPLKSRATTTTTASSRPSTVALPPLPPAPSPTGRLPPEAAQTSLPQQPQLKLVPSQTGIVLSWCVAEPDRTCATVDSYHLYAFHQDNSSSNASQNHWKKIGEVKALPLPMACTLTQFQSGSTYHFAVRPRDIYGRFGAFCEPQCTSVFNSGSG